MHRSDRAIKYVIDLHTMSPWCILLCLLACSQKSWAGTVVSAWGKPSIRPVYESQDLSRSNKTKCFKSNYGPFNSKCNCKTSKAVRDLQFAGIAGQLSRGPCCDGVRQGDADHSEM